MSKIYPLIAVLIVLAWPGLFSAYGQDCELKIESAVTAYDNGQFKEIINTLEECTKSNDPQIQWKACRLMALAYLEENEMEKARAYGIMMLEINPTYKPNVLKDPSSLIKLLNSITVIPQFSIGLSGALGMNFSRPQILNAYSVSNYSKTYIGKNSYQFGFSAAYQFNRSIAVEAGLQISNKAYDLDYSFGNWTLKSDESLTYARIPLTLIYFPKSSWRVRPYVRAGGYVGRLVAAQNNFNAEFNLDSSEYSLSNVSSMNRRLLFDYGLSGGLGLKTNLGEGHVFLQMNYAQSYANITDASQRYRYSDLIHEYYFVDDDLRLNNVSIEIGYNLYFNYKVIKD